MAPGVREIQFSRAEVKVLLPEREIRKNLLCKLVSVGVGRLDGEMMLWVKNSDVPLRFRMFSRGSHDCTNVRCQFECRARERRRVGAHTDGRENGARARRGAAGLYV